MKTNLGSSGRGPMRFLAPVLPGILFLVGCALDARAQSEGDFAYMMVANSVTITYYTGPGGAVAVPGTIAGRPVTAIEDYSFAGKTNLTSVTIPNSVTSIAIGAFYGCTGLTNMTVDALNPSFSSRDGVLFNKSQTILIQCPGGKTGSYSIPNSVTSIGGYAFRECTGLTSVTIPNSVTSIRDNAFAGCTGLTSVSIPNSVTNIGSSAFSGCTGLSSVTIPNSVTGIGGYAFYGCTGLTNITVEALNPNYSSRDGVLFNKNQSFLIQCPGGKSGSYTIPNSVTSIGFYAFRECTGLTNITVEALNPNYSSRDGVLFDKSQSILIHCPGGKSGSYTIPNSVTSIGFYAFFGSPSLTSVTIPNSVTSIEQNTFRDCASLTSVAIPNSVTNIGASAFMGCASLISISIPTSVTVIASAAFRDCAGLTSVTIPSSVATIGAEAFAYCTSLTTVTIPNGVISIDAYSFSGCTGLISITIPETVTIIGESAFAECPALTEVYFQGDAPLSVGEAVFNSSDNVTVYYLPRTTGWDTTFGERPTALWNPPNPTVEMNNSAFKILHSFSGGADGATPNAGLILSGNTLYGTTISGGQGDGTVFALNTDGSGFTNLHSFTARNPPWGANSDGAYPHARLLLLGNTLFGTGSQGGSLSNGTLFAVNTDGTNFRNLHTFARGNDGAGPYSELIASGDTLYGTAIGGGPANSGVVFAMNADGTGFTNLFSFPALIDDGTSNLIHYTNSAGATPFHGLILSGNRLYGAASQGGRFGGGSVFALNTDGTGFTNLHSFDIVSDGRFPLAALVLSDGALYGTTAYGGASDGGTVYVVNTNGSGFRTLYSFTGSPRGKLVLSGDYLYGTTGGTVWGVNTNGSGFTTLHNFANSDYGPNDGLFLSGDTFYGTTQRGGASDQGTVFSLSLAPQLTISPSANKVVVSWPIKVAGFDYFDFGLQSTTNLLKSDSWTPVTLTPVVVDSEIQITESISEASKFYRLQKLPPPFTNPRSAQYNGRRKKQFLINNNRGL
jgi:uncharacterized repeat protein (TIGR03803 family)